jgi:hypothetical protein
MDFALVSMEECLFELLPFFLTVDARQIS